MCSFGGENVVWSLKNVHIKNIPNIIFISSQSLSYSSLTRYWKLDAGAYDYPALAVPWDPKDAVDPKLSQIRGE